MCAAKLWESAPAALANSRQALYGSIQAKAMCAGAAAGAGRPLAKGSDARLRPAAFANLGSSEMLCADRLPLRSSVACRRGSDAGSPHAQGSDARLRQLLHRSGLESDGEGGSAGGSETGEDDADEDLDAMASGLQTKVS